MHCLVLLRKTQSRRTTIYQWKTYISRYWRQYAKREIPDTSSPPSNIRYRKCCVCRRASEDHRFREAILYLQMPLRSGYWNYGSGSLVIHTPMFLKGWPVSYSYTVSRADQRKLIQSQLRYRRYKEKDLLINFPAMIEKFDISSHINLGMLH